LKENEKAKFSFTLIAFLLASLLNYSIYLMRNYFFRSEKTLLSMSHPSLRRNERHEIKSRKTGYFYSLLISMTFVFIALYYFE